MGDAARDRLSDAGSIPARSTEKNGVNIREKLSNVYLIFLTELCQIAIKFGLFRDYLDKEN